MTLTTLLCPKCRNEMRTYERNGINIDQCTECRGVFLDRGELEHLLDAETAFNPGSGAAEGSDPVFHNEQPSGHRGSRRGRSPKKRRESFLSELFD
jgi:Zn-finger nucleic acid-binding protein